MPNPRAPPKAAPGPPATCPLYTFDGRRDGGDLNVAADRLGYPFEKGNTDGTIDWLRDVGPTEIVVEHHAEARGKLFSVLRQMAADAAYKRSIGLAHITVTLR